MTAPDADEARFAALLQQAPWTFAKTMPENPHEYTLRKRWADDADFVWAVEYLRAHGYASRYKGRKYIQIDVGDHFYWTMGWPIAGTILINRKPLADKEP